jgi:hypothetical protein
MTTLAGHEAADSPPRSSAESDLDFEQAAAMFLEYLGDLAPKNGSR